MKKELYKIFSDEEIDRIIRSGEKKEVDETTYFKNMKEEQCYLCMKYNVCEDAEEFGGKCPDWDYYLTCKDIKRKIEKIL